jgi:hypothetical protein
VIQQAGGKRAAPAAERGSPRLQIDPALEVAGLVQCIHRDVGAQEPDERQNGMRPASSTDVNRGARPAGNERNGQ